VKMKGGRGKDGLASHWIGFAVIPWSAVGECETKVMGGGKKTTGAAMGKSTSFELHSEDWAHLLGGEKPLLSKIVFERGRASNHKGRKTKRRLVKRYCCAGGLWELVEIRPEEKGNDRFINLGDVVSGEGGELRSTTASIWSPTHLRIENDGGGKIREGKPYSRHVGDSTLSNRM